MKCARKKSISRRAFTLVEFLVAIFLLLVIITGGLLLLSASDRTWFRGETEVRSRNEASLLVSFFNRHLQGAFLAPDWPSPRPEFIGGPREMFFCSLVSERGERTDFARLKIYFEEEKETLFIVKRRFQDAGGVFAIEDLSGAQPLLFSLRSITFTYLDRGVYHPEWDSREGSEQENRLPEAVRAEFSVFGPRMREGKRPVLDFSSFWEIKTASH